MTKSETVRTRRKSSFVICLLSQLREQGRLAFFLRQRARALLAFFHDELTQRRINRQRIVPVKTSETKRIGGTAGSLNHSFDAQITKTIDVEILANLPHRHLVAINFSGSGKSMP